MEFSTEPKKVPENSIWMDSSNAYRDKNGILHGVITKKFINGEWQEIDKNSKEE